MKKRLNLVFVTLFLLSSTSCSSNKAEVIAVKGEYKIDDKNFLYRDFEISNTLGVDISKAKIYDKINIFKKLKNVVVGDKIKVTYKGAKHTEVSKVYVDQVKIQHFHYNIYDIGPSENMYVEFKSLEGKDHFFLEDNTIFDSIFEDGYAYSMTSQYKTQSQVYMCYRGRIKDKKAPDIKAFYNYYPR